MVTFYEDGNKIEVHRLMAKGAFGRVHYGRFNNQMEVAVKKQKHTVYTEDENKYLASFKSDYILKEIFTFYRGGFIYMVTEIADGNLSDYVNELGPVVDQTIFRAITFQIITGISQIHEKGLIHRDIKPSNLLIAGNTIKICDFGFAKESASRSAFRMGTSIIMAPEVIIETPYNTSADIWSLGIVLYFLRTGAYPFENSRKYSELLKNMVGKIAFSGSIESKVKQFLDTREVQFATKGTIFEEKDVYYRHQHLIKCCLQPEAEKRHTAVQLLTHTVFKNLRDEDFHKIPRYIRKTV